MPATKHHPKWLKPGPAAEQLNCSSSYLRTLVRQGWLKMGLHYRDMSSPNSLYRRYQYNVETIATLMDKPRHQWQQYK